MLLEISIFVIAVLTIELCIYAEEYLGAVVPLIVLIAFIHFYVQFNVLTFVFQNIPQILMYFSGYLVAGVLFSLLKWKNFVSRHYEKYLSQVESAYLPTVYKIDRTEKRDYIVGHITWWAFILIVDILHKPFEFAFEYFGNIYTNIEEKQRLKVESIIEQKKTERENENIKKNGMRS